MPLIVLRHAHAGSRSAWTGDDRARPLSAQGQLEAKALIGSLGPLRPARLLASPALRCTQTVEPLGNELGVEIEVEVRLFEGTPPSTVLGLLDEVADADAVLSTHGDVIPLLLDTLVGQGMQPERSLVWQKASAWVIERTDGRWGRGRYLPPPAV